MAKKKTNEDGTYTDNMPKEMIKVLKDVDKIAEGTKHSDFLKLQFFANLLRETTARLNQANVFNFVNLMYRINEAEKRIKLMEEK